MSEWGGSLARRAGVESLRGGWREGKREGKIREKKDEWEGEGRNEILEEGKTI